MKPLTRLLALLAIFLTSGTWSRAAVIVVGNDYDIQRMRYLQPGDRLIISDGRYRGGVVFYGQGTAAKPITVEAATPGGAVFSGGTDGITALKDSRYIWFRGLQVEDATRVGFNIAESAGGKVLDCRATRCGTTGIFGGNSPGLIVEDCQSWANIGQHGIYLSGDGADRSIIRNNHCWDNAGAGIQLNAQGGTADGIVTECIVEGNVLERNGRLGGAAVNLIGVQRSVIRGNRLDANAAGGIALSSSDPTSPGKAGSNNRIEGNTIGGTTRWAISLRQRSTGNRVERNTIAGGGAGIYFLEPGSGLTASENTYSVPVGIQFWTTGTVQADYTSWQSLGVDVGSSLTAPAIIDPILPGAP